jgi:hypothetical protein
LFPTCRQEARGSYGFDNRRRLPKICRPFPESNV